jgi:hypothetical protein
VNYAYAHVKTGQIIGLANYYLPIGQKDVGSVSEYVAPDESQNHLSRITGHLLKVAPAFIILSKSQEAYGEEVVGDNPGWETKVEHSLMLHGYYVVAHWNTATVLRKSPLTINAFSTLQHGGSGVQSSS